jgi:peptidoglycan L-alanyl-D-glutamate endopeptidase CwlK
MKNHSKFAEELATLKLAPLTLQDVMNLSSKGVAPEGMGSDAKNKIVDTIYSMSDSNFTSAIPEQIAEASKSQTSGTQTVVRRTFAFGKTSLARLVHLRPELRNVCMEAIKISLVDMTVVQTIRSIDEQRRNVANGNSRTMKSKHLPQVDGFAWAVDLAAFVNGKISWEPGYYADIAFAMDQAATKLGLAMHVRWGAAWDRVLADFGGTRGAYLAEAQAYAQRHAGSDLIDMPHFEFVV